MSLFRCAFALAVLTLGSVTATNAQEKKTFPTDDEIKLVLTQTERAVQQYKPLIELEEIQIGSSAAGAASKDRQVVEALEIALVALKKNPQGFNGPLGFPFFEWVDDAGRNALLCSSGAASESALQMTAGKIEKATSLLHLSQSCMDASTLIYAVSENAGALYQRYVEAEERLATRGSEVAQKCVEILKKNGIAQSR